MEQTIDDISVLFHERARQVFFAVCQSYTANLSSIKRSGHEHMFQHSINQLLDELHFKLQTIIKEMISRSNTKVSPTELNGILTQLASAYEKEFMQKVKSL